MEEESIVFERILEERKRKRTENEFRSDKMKDDHKRAE
jgi:hypothetical protein